MRKILVGLVAVTSLALASTASASTVSFIWTSTSTAGVISTATITSGVNVNPSDVVTMDVIVTADSLGITAVLQSMSFASSVLVATGSTSCPSPPNFAAGSCGDPFGPNGFGGIIADAMLDSIIPGGVLSLGGISGLAGAPAGQVSFTFTLASITFHYAGGGTFVDPTGNFQAGLDGYSDGFSALFTPTQFGATINGIPEPGTFALMALGLGALGLAGRRR